jgi:hypothetical protein
VRDLNASAGGSAESETTEDDDVQRLNVIKEIISTERTYLDDLEILANVSRVFPPVVEVSS